MTALLHWSDAKQRWYVRRFDHDEARTKHAAGESISALAHEYGVNPAAVRFVVDPVAHAQGKEATRRHLGTPCETCGERCIRADAAMKRKHNPDGRALCYRCRKREMRTRYRLDELGQLAAVFCSICKRWLPPEEFGAAAQRRWDAGGVPRNDCRECGTRMRQAHREARKVPCRRCGEPRTHPKDGGGRNDTGLCLKCWRIEAAA